MQQASVRYFKCLVILFLVGTVYGCAGKNTEPGAGPVIPAVPEGISVQPAIAPEYQVGRPAEGSLWTRRGGSFFEDVKATRVGDTVIVDIVENASSRLNANTEAERNSGIDIGAPTINMFGLETNFGAGPAGGTMIGTDFKTTFSGEGRSDRSGQVTASIAARITEVLPNGNLTIFGRRAMKVNNEEQYIVVSGIVRPEDISSTNRVQSTFLADSRIEYYGKGALADKQNPGWGTRIVDKLWPF